MKIQNKELSIPIIQGGMGVGVSASRLAGNVALCGGMGVISSVNIGYKENDFLTNPKEANLRALRKEIQKAKELAHGNGLVAVNIMTAVSHYEQTCQCVVEAGADAIISGAGIPLKLPGFVKGSNTLCAPIVSSARAAKIICKSYDKNYQMLPDFMIIEGHQAGGHLGFSAKELVEHTAVSNEEILKEVLEVLHPFEEKYGRKIPVFVAGGVFDGRDMARFIKLGASGVQIGTRFIATDECDAADGFKQAIVNAQKEDIQIIESPVGMPARALLSPLLQSLKSGEKYLAKVCSGCLTACKRGSNIPYCISRALIEAVKGNWQEGLFFCGENAYRINKIIPVKELMNTIVTEWRECS